MKKVCYSVGILLVFLAVSLIGLHRRNDKRNHSDSMPDAVVEYTEEDISASTASDSDMYANKNEHNIYTMQDGPCVYDGFAYEVLEARVYDSLNEFKQMDGYNEEYHHLCLEWREEHERTAQIVYVKYRLTNISDSASRGLSTTKLGVAYVDKNGNTCNGLSTEGYGPYCEAMYSTIPENVIDEKNFDCPMVAPQETLELEIAFVITGTKDGKSCKPYDMYDESGDWYFTSAGNNISMSTSYNIYDDMIHIKIKLDTD